METSVAPPPHPQTFIDAEHLKLLSIFHYVMAGMCAIGGCIPLMHVGLGVMMLSGKAFGTPASGTPPPPPEMGWFFIGMGTLFILIIQTCGVLSFLTGRWIAARKHHTFCMVVAGLECLSVPIGTLLGVFSIIVLQRPSVRALFEARRRTI